MNSKTSDKPDIRKALYGALIILRNLKIAKKTTLFNPYIYEYIHIVRYLINSKEDANMADPYGRTLLMCASFGVGI